MRKFFSMKGTICCSPPDTTQIELVKKNNFAMVKQKTSLIPLKVKGTAEFDLEISLGDTVYVRGEAITNHSWAKEVFTIEGFGSFIVVPNAMIMVIDALEMLETEPDWGPEEVPGCAVPSSAV